MLCSEIAILMSIFARKFTYLNLNKNTCQVNIYLAVVCTC